MSNDEYRFRLGPPLELRADGTLVRVSRVRVWLREAWRHLTWWRHPRMRVAQICADEGRITMEPVRWSWRRWRWERDAGPLNVRGHGRDHTR